jgi:hypothetical protein
MGVADSPNRRRFTCLTPPMRPASIVSFISNQLWLVVLSAAAGGAYTQPKPLTGSAPELPGLRTDR